MLPLVASTVRYFDVNRLLFTLGVVKIVFFLISRTVFAGKSASALPCTVERKKYHK